jgi:ABC-2 type transport system permease protein
MIAVELLKLARRPRTWVSLGLLCGLPILVAVFLWWTKLGPKPGEQPAFLAAVLANGALFPAAALAIVLPLFLPVAVAVIGGDAVAGEASAGTLRYLLLRPVGRTRLLVAKLVAMVVYVLTGVVLVVATSLVVGAEPVPVRADRGDVGVRGGADPAAAGPAHRRRDALRGGVDAGRGRDRVVPVHVDRLAAGRGAGCAGGAGHQPGPGDAGCRRVGTAVPADPLLVGLDRPVPRSHTVGGTSTAGLAIQAVYVLVFLGAAWANFASKDIKS